MSVADLERLDRMAAAPVTPSTMLTREEANQLVGGAERSEVHRVAILPSKGWVSLRSAPPPALLSLDPIFLNLRHIEIY